MTDNSEVVCKCGCGHVGPWVQETAPSSAQAIQHVRNVADQQRREGKGSSFAEYQECVRS